MFEGCEAIVAGGRPRIGATGSCAKHPSDRAARTLALLAKTVTPQEVPNQNHMREELTWYSRNFRYWA